MAAPLVPTGVVFVEVFYFSRLAWLIIYITWARKNKLTSWTCKFCLKQMFQFQMIKQNSIKKVSSVTNLWQHLSSSRHLLNGAWQCEHSCETGSDVTSLVRCEAHVQGIRSQANIEVRHYPLDAFYQRSYKTTLNWTEKCFHHNSFTPTNAPFINHVEQRFSNFFQVGTTFITQNVLRTTFISQNVLRTTLLLGLSNSLGLP